MRPLDWAVINGHHAAAQLLCSADSVEASKPARPIINDEPHHCSSALTLAPLDLAAAADDVEMVRVLLVGGARERTTDERGITTRALARALGHERVLHAFDEALGSEGFKPHAPARAL